jgi:cytochrome c oxidase subunit 4
VTIKSYILVWAGLLALTAATVITAKLGLGRLSIYAVIFIAAVKSTLVMLFFMHLREEKLLIFKLLVPIALVTLTIFIGLSFTDIAAR